MAILAGKRCREIPEDFVMREADRVECEVTGLTPEELLSRSIQGAWECYEVRTSSGELVGVWGVAAGHNLDLSKNVWFLSSEAADRWPVSVGKHSREIFDYLFAGQHEGWPRAFECMVHAEHTLSRKWLTWLGFRETIAVEINGAPFLVMRIERKGDPNGVLG